MKVACNFRFILVFSECWVHVLKNHFFIHSQHILDNGTNKLNKVLCLHVTSIMVTVKLVIVVRFLTVFWSVHNVRNHCNQWVYKNYKFASYSLFRKLLRKAACKNINVNMFIFQSVFCYSTKQALESIRYCITSMIWKFVIILYGIKEKWKVYMKKNL